MAEQPIVVHIVNENLQDALDGFSESDYWEAKAKDHKLVADTLVPAIRAIKGVTEVRDAENGYYVVTFESGQAANKLDKAIKDMSAAAAGHELLTAISCVCVKGDVSSHSIHLQVEQPSVAMQIAASLTRAAEAEEMENRNPNPNNTTEADIRTVASRMVEIGVKTHHQTPAADTSSQGKKQSLSISYDESDAGRLAESIAVFAARLHSVGVSFSREIHFSPQMFGTNQIHSCKTIHFHDGKALAAVARELDRLAPALTEDMRRKAAVPEQGT